LEAVKTSRIANLLGARIADDSARTDAASEREAVRLRIPWVETRLQAAEAAGDAEETERLRGRLSRDVERLAWLDRAVEFVSPENLNYPAVHPGDLAALRAVLPAETLFLECAVDIYGAVAVAVGADFVEARALGLNETAALAGLRTVRDALAASADPAAPLAALSAPLLDPCADRLTQARRVVVCPDEVLSPLPWPLMAVGGTPLGQSHVLSFAESAGLLLKALEKPAVKAARLRALLPAAAAGDAAGLPGGDHVFGVEATLTRLLEGAVPEDLVYLSAKVNLTPPDPMLCPVLLGGDGVQGETPPARVLGLNLPAAVVMLDWTPEPAGAALRSDLVSVTSEAFRHAGAPSVILPLWPVARRRRGSISPPSSPRRPAPTAPRRRARGGGSPARGASGIAGLGGLPPDRRLPLTGGPRDALVRCASREGGRAPRAHGPLRPARGGPARGLHPRRWPRRPED
jgi:hypothetical protein